MERTFLKKMLAIGLSAAMAFTAAPFMSRSTRPVEALAEEKEGTISVEYTVQVNQSGKIIQPILDGINAARTAATESSGTVQNDSSVNATAADKLKYNASLEDFAIERAKDIALYDNNDGTRPDGSAEETITSSSDINVSAMLTYSEPEGTSPVSDLIKEKSVLDSATRSLAIGHVTYNNQDFYCVILSKDESRNEDIGSDKTGYRTSVQRYLSYSNIGKIYAAYTYDNGVTYYDPVEFVDGNGSSTAKLPDTIADVCGQNASIPSIKYQVSTNVTAGSTSSAKYDVSDISYKASANDTKAISVNGNSIKGNAVGSYTVTYEANVAGKRTLFDIPVTVNKANLSNATMTVDTSTTYYANGTESKPKVTVSMPGATGNLVEGTDYTLKYANNKPATSVTTEQTATVTATGIGNYEGSIQRTFKIQPTNGGRLSEATITVTEKNIVYDGKEKKPKATVSLHGVTVPESSYTLKYSNNVKAGTANITAAAKSGDERYSGVAKGTFTIAQADISTADFTFADSDNKSNTSPQYSYTGADIKPEPGIKVDSLTLTKNTDFTYSYSNNKAIGTQAAVTVTGKGNFTGTASMNFEITQGDITKATVTATPSSTFTYNGQRQYPSYVMVSIDGHQLTQGVDYDISPFPTDAVNAGTYRYTITGKNNFKGTGTTTATGTTSGTGSTSTSTNTNTTSTTGTTSSDNAIVSTDKAAGTITAQYTIQAKDVSKASDISVPKISNRTYNGKAQKPAVTVVDNTRGAVLTEGTDYTRTDASNTTPGTATVTLTFSGNYTGTKTLSYKIVPKKTSISRVSAGKKKATVSYKKVSGISGYQVKAGTNRAVTKGTKTKNTTKTKYTMNSLKSKKRYYFKVRTYYTTSAGKKVYSSWSGVKSVKVK